MATTAQTIIDAGYRKCGILLPTSEEEDNGLEALNDMISSWTTEYLSPYVTRESKALTAGTAEYTIGSGGNLDTVRPMSVLNCYLVDTDGYSYKNLDIMSAKDYNRVLLKTAEGRPTGLYFVPEYPLAKVIFNYEPDAVYTAYFEFQKQITEFAALSTTVSLPLEYKEALIYNLAIKLAEDNSIGLSQSVLTTAEVSKFLLSRTNAANRIPPKARFDFIDGRPSNITTGE